MTEQRTYTCKLCGEPIEWGDLPDKPGQRAPFNVVGGELHFATCPKAKEARRSRMRKYSSIKEYRKFLIDKGCPEGCAANTHIHMASMRDGREYLRATCRCHGRYLDALPMNEQNRSLIDKDRDWHMVLD